MSKTEPLSLLSRILISKSHPEFSGEVIEGQRQNSTWCLLLVSRGSRPNTDIDSGWGRDGIPEKVAHVLGMSCAGPFYIHSTSILGTAKPSKPTPIPIQLSISERGAFLSLWVMCASM